MFEGSLVPRPSLPPVFDHLQYVESKQSKTGTMEEGLGTRLFEGPSLGKYNSQTDSKTSNSHTCRLVETTVCTWCVSS